MNQKIINNAISSYFWLWLLLLIPSKKENINHPFVKKHAKTAVFIHFLMLINYVIFISFWLLWRFSFYWFALNHILASILFIWLFWWILYWVLKANSWTDFSIQDMSNMTKTSNLIEIKSSNLNEQWILTIILSLIPFVWFYIKARFYHYKSPIIENNAKLNIIITFLISSFFCFWYENLWLLFWLFYLIFIWFFAILLITKQNIISINLDKILTFEEIYIYTLSFFDYLKNYFTNKKFVSIKEIILTKKTEILAKSKENKVYLDTLKNPKIKNILAYIPFLNIFSLIDINSKNKNHIINWLSITILSIIFMIFDINNYQIYLIFLIFFGVWYLEKIEYKFPFLFNIYEFWELIFKKIFSNAKKVKDMQTKENEISFNLEKSEN